MFWLVLSWSGFCLMDHFHGKGHVIGFVFLFSKAGKVKTNMARVPYNKLLTNLASSSHNGEYWPLDVSVWSERSEICTATSSGQYPPVRPLCSVSERLIFSPRETCSVNTSTKLFPVCPIFAFAVFVIVAIIIFSYSKATASLAFFHWYKLSISDISCGWSKIR